MFLFCSHYRKVTLSKDLNSSLYLIFHNKKIISEIKDPHKSYIGRVIYKDSVISFPFKIGGGYFAELEDTRTNKKL